MRELRLDIVPRTTTLTSIHGTTQQQIALIRVWTRGGQNATLEAAVVSNTAYDLILPEPMIARFGVSHRHQGR